MRPWRMLLPRGTTSYLRRSFHSPVMKPPDSIRRAPSRLERRRFMAMITGGLLVTPFTAEAQKPGKVYRIGVLLPLGVTPPIFASFLAGMRDRGWVENKGFVAEPRYAEGRLEHLPELAAELVRLTVDVLVTMGAGNIGAVAHELPQRLARGAAA